MEPVANVPNFTALKFRKAIPSHSDQFDSVELGNQVINKISRSFAGTFPTVVGSNTQIWNVS